MVQPIFIRLSSFLLMIWAIVSVAEEQPPEERYSKYEIRVIRPKYFTKGGRLELGTQINSVMNQTFIYTYLASGILAYHFNEQWGLEASGAYGISQDKEDKTKLKQEFNIRTEILRTQYLLDLSLLYTPIYGKYQLSSGRLIYFDTFLSLGGGMTGINYLYDHCLSRDDVPQAKIPPPDKPPPKTVSYMTFLVGGGQRFFLNKEWSLRWDVRYHMFQSNSLDGACDPSRAIAEKKTQNNIYLQLGTGYFL